MDLQKYEKENLDLVLNTAGECAVLLKTDGSFPLEKPCSIAAFGNGVRHTIKGGTGSGEVNSRFSVNIEKGLTDAGYHNSACNDLCSNAFLVGSGQTSGVGDLDSGAEHGDKRARGGKRTSRILHSAQKR